MIYTPKRFFKIAITFAAVVVLAIVTFFSETYNRQTIPFKKLESTLSTLLQSWQKSESKDFKQITSKGPFRITHVIDGDTIVLNNGERVRLIGVDAPEIAHDGIPGERYGKEAKEFLQCIAEGHECTLEYEPNDIRDQYGRLLAYVFRLNPSNLPSCLPSGKVKKGGQGGIGNLLLNAEMIRNGYAYTYTRFPFRRQTEFLRLEQEAREKHSGIWHTGGIYTSSSKSRTTDTPHIIPWQDAYKHYGEYKIVEGSIVATHNSGKACFLNFSYNYKQDLTAVIFSSAFPHFPANPENYYYGKKVRVAGYIKKYHGKPEIVLNHPGQIEILK